MRHETTVDRFNRRAFVAVGMSVTGLALPISGYANHVLQFDGLTVARHAWVSVSYMGWACSTSVQGIPAPSV